MIRKSLLTASCCLAAMAISAAVPVSPRDNGEPTPDSRFDLSLISGTTQKAHKVMAREAEEDNTIYEVPEGEVISAKVYADGYMYHWRGPVGTTFSGPGEYVICEDGDVYIKNPITFINTNGYLKGHIEGDKVKVSLPQPVGYIEDWEGNKYYVEATMMSYKITDPEYNVGWFFNVTDPEENYLEYDYDAETMTMSFDFTDNVSEGALLLGLSYDPESTEADSWTYYGVRKQILTPFTDKVTVLPEDLQLEDWAIVYNGIGGWFNPAGIQDNTFYAKFDFFSDMDPMIVKGDINGNTITFPDRQYLGIESTNYVYAVCCNVTFDELGYPSFTLANEPIVCDYDAEANLITCPDGKALVINYGYDRVAWLTAIYNFTFRIQTPEMQYHEPKNPIFRWYQPEIYYSEYYTQPAQLCLNIPNVSDDGYLLEPENLSWEMYVDDELYTFDTDLYQYMPEPMSQIPWLYNDIWDIWSDNSSLRSITIHFSGFDKISFMSFNDAPNGRTYESGECIILFSDPNAVETLSTEKTQVGEFFTNLAGVRVENPSKGIYVKTTLFSDGTKKSSKVVVR